MHISNLHKKRLYIFSSDKLTAKFAFELLINWRVWKLTFFLSCQGMGIAEGFNIPDDGAAYYRGKIDIIDHTHWVNNTRSGKPCQLQAWQLIMSYPIWMSCLCTRHMFSGWSLSSYLVLISMISCKLIEAANFGFCNDMTKIWALSKLLSHFKKVELEVNPRTCGGILAFRLKRQVTGCW